MTKMRLHSASTNYKYKVIQTGKDTLGSVSMHNEHAVRVY